MFILSRTVMGLIYFVKLLRQVPLTDDQKKEVLKMDKTIGPTERRSYICNEAYRSVRAYRSELVISL